jgi:pyruvate/2-oxoglutarate dehydrogenase complex dihydrolipoamide dehydrogenase (E3) component
MEVVTGIGGVERIIKGEEGLRLEYTAGEERRSITAEAVVMATGWVGNSEGLNLEAAGVRVEKSFVWVDDYFRTSAPHIFAAGDITGRMMLVQSAGYEARVAAENAVLGAAQRYRHKIVPHGGFTDPEYGSVGLTEARAREEQEIVVATVPYADMDRAVIDGRTDGFCKLIVSAESHRILGVHVVGEQALEVVQLIAAAMAGDMWVEQLAELELAYPTIMAILGLAARLIVRDLGVTPLAPEWRALRPVREAGAEWELGEGLAL